MNNKFRGTANGNAVNLGSHSRRIATTNYEPYRYRLDNSDRHGLPSIKKRSIIRLRRGLPHRVNVLYRASRSLSYRYWRTLNLPFWVEVEKVEKVKRWRVPLAEHGECDEQKGTSKRWIRSKGHVCISIQPVPLAYLSAFAFPSTLVDLTELHWHLFHVCIGIRGVPKGAQGAMRNECALQ